MNENDFGRAIADRLNRGVASGSGFDDQKLARLMSARQQALAAYREPVSVLGLATVSGHVLEPAYWLKKPLVWAVPALAIAIYLGVTTLAPTDEVYDDVGELDAKLLTGELPIDAFLDKDFATWVKESS